MPILTAAVLGTAAIKGLKKAAPYIAAAGAAAGAYVAHKYSIHKIKTKYRNTTIDQDTAQEINKILTDFLKAAIEGNLKTNSREDLIEQIVDKALIKAETENVSILTTRRIFEKKALDKGRALGSPKEDMEETISQFLI